MSKRIISAEINDIRIINVYVPNGSSINSDKFIYKEKMVRISKVLSKKNQFKSYTYMFIRRL